MHVLRSVMTPLIVEAHHAPQSNQHQSTHQSTHQQQGGHQQGGHGNQGGPLAGHEAGVGAAERILGHDEALLLRQAFQVDDLDHAKAVTEAVRAIDKVVCREWRIERGGRGEEEGMMVSGGLFLFSVYCALPGTPEENPQRRPERWFYSMFSLFAYFVVILFMLISCFRHKNSTKLGNENLSKILMRK